MNARYRKQMRLRSRHARHGHIRPGWCACNCPEENDRVLYLLAAWKRKHGPFPPSLIGRRIFESKT